MSAGCNNSTGLLDCEPDPVGCPLGDGSTVGGTIVSGVVEGVDAEEEEVSPEPVTRRINLMGAPVVGGRVDVGVVGALIEIDVEIVGAVVVVLVVCAVVTREIGRIINSRVIRPSSRISEMKDCSVVGGGVGVTAALRDASIARFSAF